METDFENSYHQAEAKHWWFVGRRDLIIALLRETNADSGSRILDVGCAGGTTIQQLNEAGFAHVSGIDISGEAIAQCRRIGLRDVYQMDAQAPDFPDDSFDIIVASDVLEHVSDENAAVREWFRILSPGGCLIALVPAFMALWSAHDEANQHRKRYRLHELRQCFAACGFETQRASYWNFLLFVPAAMVRMLQRAMADNDQPIVELRVPPSMINIMFSSLLRGENRMLTAGVNWPWGLSALVVARRPVTAQEPRQ
jgi:SAM-dependent methyltransferase